ncbi:hypothetical protein [Endozoicomonas sp. SCSIO W0465]|uniref:hypothetical protein n=1 Tax=Endozoicomonas sp. SCSIO W0465 TaxID=2918516 RepID=UPI0020761578|nr:hypothetical protein [Endozoicomonas sp. SCSIO W0465]USE34922.1 hypothetical protein MJO57_22775 [Endozoicomonas sp. SCSIO W0465]
MLLRYRHWVKNDEVRAIIIAAMGYTWEVDLQIFMKRAWALASSYGTQGFHKQRIKQFILADEAQLGAGSTFM